MIRNVVLAVALAVSSGAAPALADGSKTEIIAIGNSSNDDSSYLQFKIRQAMSGDLNNGWSAQFGVGRSSFSYTGGSGTNTALRLTGEYNMPAGPGTLSLGFGIANVDVANTPAVASDFNRTGAFASIHYDADLANGDSLVGLLEYTDASSSTYAGGHYLFGTGTSFKVGPTFNAVRESGYERNMLGLRASYFVGTGSDITATVTRGNQTIGVTKSNLTTLELLYRVEF